MNKEQNIYIRTLELAGIASTLKAMRLPMKSESRSDSCLEDGFLCPSVVFEGKSTCYPYGYKIFYEKSKLLIGEKDIYFSERLVLNGDDHAKAMRGIIVWAEMNLPRYIWQEMDTYTVGVIPLSSESTMHCDARGLKKEELVKFKENLPEGHVQKRIRAFSYQTLRRIYFQRRTHRLPIWQEIVIPWIKSLPLSEELITIKKELDVNV